MKILIVSDTHGNSARLTEVLGKFGKLDLLLHCGDIEGETDYIREKAGCEFHVVRGNCDYDPELPVFDIVTAGAYRIFMAHGHTYHVGWGTDELKDVALANECSVAVYGHTHVPEIDTSDPEITVLNPGSISRPRQDGAIPTYILMEIDREGKAHYTLCEMREEPDLTLLRYEWPD